MAKYRKKPVVVDAIQWTGRNWKAVCEFIGHNTRYEHFECGHVLQIRTLEGDMDALPGDWIIKGIKGEFYPCKDDIFRKTYDPVRDGEK